MEGAGVHLRRAFARTPRTSTRFFSSTISAMMFPEDLSAISVASATAESNHHLRACRNVEQATAWGIAAPTPPATSSG